MTKMFELKRRLSEQIESTKIFFDKNDAEWEFHRAQDADDYDEPALRELTIEQFVAEAREAGYDDWEIFEMLLNEADGFSEMAQKATAYDKMIEARRKGAEKANAISAEERKARAKKAAKARWQKIKG